MVASGPPATINSEPRQARKGATVVMDLCAGVWLEVPPPHDLSLIVPNLKTLCLWQLNVFC